MGIKNKYFRIFLTFIILSTAMKLLISFIWTQDENIVLIEEWLKSEPNVVQKFGENTEFSLKTSVVVQGSENESGYSRYTFIVKGNDLRSAIVVDDRLGSYRIRSIN